MSEKFEPLDIRSIYSDSLLRLVKGKALYGGNPEESFSQITEAGAETINVERVSIWMYSEDRKSIQSMDLYELTPNRHSRKVVLSETDFPSYFAAMNEDRVIDANDAHVDSRTSEFSEQYLTPLGITSMLDAPIRYGGLTIGVICIEHVGIPREWTPEETTYAGSLADLISHAVEAQKRITAEKALIESEERYRRTASLTKTGHQTWDEIEDRVIYCSEELAAMYGVSVEEYLRRSSSVEKDLEWFHADDRERYWAVTQAAVRNKTGYEIIARIIRDDGQVRYIHEITDVKLDSKGNLLQTIGAMQDITESKLIEQELRTQGQIITNMVEGALLIRTSDNIIVYSNPSAEVMFGYKAGELLGKKITSLYTPANSNPVRESKNLIRELSSKKKWHGEIYSVRKDSTQFWCSVNVSELEHPVYGKVWVFVGSDITERRQANEKLVYQARHDGLTGLINRAEFERRAHRLISSVRKRKEAHALCYMDLDQFKIVNDNCGHSAGDELLRQLGQVLHDSVRPRDTLARLGGDEFGVLMENCTLSQAQRAVADLQQNIQEFHFIWEGQSFRIGVSIGLVAIDESTPSLTELLRHADAACYTAKDLGRNRIHVYHPEDAEIAQRHGEMQWVSHINQALADNRFTLYAQEILNFRQPEDQHFELLLRMIDEQGNIVPPGAFLPAAERYEIMDKLDDWVIRNALALMSNHSSLFTQIRLISINLSGQSLTNPAFLDTVISKIQQFKIDTSKLCFEITETAAISNINSASAFIAKLKGLGCRFALDDFGSGLSSFGYLKSLPVDYLKIDGMFVKGMVDDPIDCSMVKSINDIGHVMGMKTIAEFVENDDIRDMLKEIGVDFAQGYGIGKPKPFLELIE